MAKISDDVKYQNKILIDGDDFLIGTEAVGKGSKTFKLSDIGKFIKTFLNLSEEEEAAFGSHVFGFTKEGKAVKVPIGNFQGSLIGTLEGDYSTVETENITNNQDYL